MTGVHGGDSLEPAIRARDTLHVTRVRSAN